MSRNILIVDGDAKASYALATDLRRATGWNFETAGNASDALAELKKTAFHAVITSLQLPGAGGWLLLNEVMKSQPNVHRIVLAQLSDRHGLLKCVGSAHQFIGRPCDPNRLRAALERAFSYDLWLPDEAVQVLLGRLPKLPSPPDLFFRVVKELESPHAELEGVGRLIAKDVAITAKLLQLVNSAIFGISRPLSSAVEAVMHLGLETTKSMILLAHCFSYFDGIKAADFSPDQLWQHSLRVGMLAKAIARSEGATTAVSDETYTAGILHDLGKLALAANLPEEFGEAMAISRAEGIPQAEAEQRIFGASHAEVGASLLATWGLAPEIVESLALHHVPARLLHRSFCPLTAVHAANALENALTSNAKPVLDVGYLTELGLADRVTAWQEILDTELAPADTGAAA